MTRPQGLNELARLYGIHTSYIDMNGQRRDADPEALLLVLRAMGTGVERFEDVVDALQRRQAELRDRVVEPVMVAWDGVLNGRQFEFGYHWVDVEGHKTFVISAPQRAYFPSNRSWGLFAPIYALHSTRNPNAGDLTDFESLMDWMGGLGGTVAATLPLLGAFLGEPFDPSPYAPATRLFWNEFYIDFTRVAEFEDNLEAKRLAGARPRKSEFVGYRGIMAWKRRILEELSRSFFAGAKPERLAAFHGFVREHKEAEDYARFRAVTDRRRKGWNDWPDRLRGGKIRDGDYDEETKDYHLYAQWIVEDQLQALIAKAAARNQMLYLDLPLGMHPDGYDIWRSSEFFARGVSGGAPPDLVFTQGQNWHFPPMHPEAMRLNGYQYVIAYIRNHLRLAKLLRIDHVMGLHRLYWIPDELTGDKGVYVEYPAEELYAILSLESHRHQAGIVGENLGLVPPEVNAAMDRHNIAKMYVAQFEMISSPHDPGLPPVPEHCVASLNTHDTPPFRALLEGADIDDRLDLGFLNEETARAERERRALMKRKLGSFRTALQFLAESKARIVLVNLEDLWGEVLPQNVPATNKERPNWRRRVRPSIEQIRVMADAVEVLSHVFADRSRHLSV